MPLRNQLTLPYPVKRQEKIIIIGKELPSSLQNKEGIELVSVENISQTVEKGEKIKAYCYLIQLCPLIKAIHP